MNRKKYFNGRVNFCSFSIPAQDYAPCWDVPPLQGLKIPTMGAARRSKSGKLELALKGRKILTMDVAHRYYQEKPELALKGRDTFPSLGLTAIR